MEEGLLEKMQIDERNFDFMEKHNLTKLAEQVAEKLTRIESTESLESVLDTFCHIVLQNVTKTRRMPRL